jgi:hypothetical protein
MFNWNGDMAAMFPSDQYDENTMFSLDALWNFDDDVPMHLEGQQVAAADSTTAANATGTLEACQMAGKVEVFDRTGTWELLLTTVLICWKSTYWMPMRLISCSRKT